MNPSSPSLLASVLYLRVADFTRKPAPEQGRLRVQLDMVAGRALQTLPIADRIVLDASDGLVIVVLANPEGALDAAERCLQAAASLPLAIGINHGPVAPVAGNEAPAGMEGDGIAAAELAAGFASPRQLLATRAFRDALAEQAPARDALLQPAGVFSDDRRREYALHAPGPQGPAQRRRRVLAIAAGSALALLVAAIGLGGGLFAKPAVLAFEISPSGRIYIDGEHKGATPPLTQLELRAGSHRVEVRHAEHPPMFLDVDLKPGQQLVVRHRFEPAGVLLLEIQPGGEVFVDGLPKGHIPGLDRLELSIGQHRVDVYYESFPPLTVNVSLQPGQQALLRHRFEIVEPAEEPLDPTRPRRKPGGRQ